MGTSTKTSSVCGSFLEMNIFDDLQFAIGPHTTCFSEDHIDSTMKTSFFYKRRKTNRYYLIINYITNDHLCLRLVGPTLILLGLTIILLEPYEAKRRVIKQTRFFLCILKIHHTTKM